MAQRLEARIDAGSELTNDEMQALYDLRFRMREWPESVDEKAEMAKYASAVKRSTVVRILDAGGQLHGSMVFEEQPLDDTWCLVVPRYAYMSKAARGHRAPMVAYARLYLRLRRRYRRFIVGGVGFPTSVLAGHRWTGNLTFLDEAETPRERLAFERILASFPGTDPTTGRLTGLPPTRRQPAWWYERIERDPVYQRYVQRNPDWEKGVLLVGLCVIPTNIVARLVWKYVCRAWQGAEGKRTRAEDLSATTSTAEGR